MIAFLGAMPLGLCAGTSNTSTRTLLKDQRSAWEVLLLRLCAFSTTIRGGESTVYRSRIGNLDTVQEAPLGLTPECSKFLKVGFLVQDL